MEELSSAMGFGFDEGLVNALIKKEYLVEKQPGLFDLKRTFNGKFRRLHYLKPSEAVLTNFGSVRNYVHPVQDRPLTVRECARIHGFPDSFVFRGSTHSQYTQVGNAVPPKLAFVFARAVTRIIRPNVGALKSPAGHFVPHSVRQIFERLEKTYGAPPLGNRRNPLDELVYLYISQRTFEKSYQTVFRNVKKRYVTFDGLRGAKVEELAEILRPAGLARQKAEAIIGTLSKIYSDFGETSLRTLRRKDEEGQLDYLLSLPRVGLKTAHCVMLFCLDRKLLPIDANVRRVCQRLGLLAQKLDIRNESTILHTLIPPENRLSFHVNCIEHARKCCLPLHPRCHECSIHEFCQKIEMPKKEKDIG